MGKITEQNRRELQQAKKYEDAAIAGMVDHSFTDVLNELFHQKNSSTQEIVNKTGISKSYINKLRSSSLKKVNPSRSKVINIGLALGGTENEINSLLKAAGLQPLYSRSEEESVIIWGLLHGKNYEQISVLLDEKGFGSFMEQ